MSVPIVSVLLSVKKPFLPPGFFTKDSLRVCKGLKGVKGLTPTRHGLLSSACPKGIQRIQRDFRRIGLRRVELRRIEAALSRVEDRESSIV